MFIPELYAKRCEQLAKVHTELLDKVEAAPVHNIKEYFVKGIRYIPDKLCPWRRNPLRFFEAPHNVHINALSTFYYDYFEHFHGKLNFKWGDWRPWVLHEFWQGHHKKKFNAVLELLVLVVDAADDHVQNAYYIGGTWLRHKKGISWAAPTHVF